MKLRSMWRTESVDSTVLMPRRAASRPANVLLPVPLVPARSTVTDLRCSRMLQGTADAGRPVGSAQVNNIGQQTQPALALVGLRRAWGGSAETTGEWLSC